MTPCKQPQNVRAFLDLPRHLGDRPWPLVVGPHGPVLLFRPVVVERLARIVLLASEQVHDLGEMCSASPERFRVLIEPHLDEVASRAARRVCKPWTSHHLDDCSQHVALWLLEPENLARLTRRYDYARYGENPDRLRAFLYPYALGEARHFLRKEARQARRWRSGGDGLLGLIDLTGGNPPDEELAHREEEAQREALAARVEQALDTLPIEQQIAFELVVLHGMKKSAVAELRGRDRGTIASWVKKAASHLEKALSS